MERRTFIIGAIAGGIGLAEYGGVYVQSWGQGQTLSERSPQRIFQAADQILLAGYRAR